MGAASGGRGTARSGTGRGARGRAGRERGTGRARLRRNGVWRGRAGPGQAEAAIAAAGDAAALIVKNARPNGSGNEQSAAVSRGDYSGTWGR